jgi:hypothetical protein
MTPGCRHFRLPSFAMPPALYAAAAEFYCRYAGFAARPPSRRRMF